MIYIVLLIIVIAIVVFTLTNLLQDKISLAEHPGYVRAGIFFSFVVLLVFFITIFFEENDEGLTPIGFTEVDKRLFEKNFDGYKVRIQYDPQGKSRHSLNRADRIELTIKSSLNREAISRLFCSPEEFEDFLVSDREWFPTKHRKLENGYYVGECYPQDLIAEIEKLASPTHGFEPRYARYLFIPTVETESNTLLLKFQDENIETLNEKIEKFLSFYRIYMPS